MTPRAFNTLADVVQFAKMWGYPVSILLVPALSVRLFVFDLFPRLIRWEMGDNGDDLCQNNLT